MTDVPLGTVIEMFGNPWVKASAHPCDTEQWVDAYSLEWHTLDTINRRWLDYWETRIDKQVLVAPLNFNGHTYHIELDSESLVDVVEDLLW
jgi:hypothetical protein